MVFIVTGSILMGTSGCPLGNVCNGQFIVGIIILGCALGPIFILFLLLFGGLEWNNWYNYYRLT